MISKKTEITPIFRKGEETDPINYRPTSITPALAKFVDIHTTVESSNGLQRTEKILSPRQLGFRQTRSTKDALLTANEKTMNKISKKFLHSMCSGSFIQSF